jgi:CDP-diacylglycerol--glycerol-3-phosphate 3-phosphatidyltransferase
VFVDALRSVAPSRGLTPFGLMRSRLGRFMVESPWLRSPYGIAKAAAFCLLAVNHAMNVASFSRGTTIAVAAQVTAWIAVGFCVARALPVLIEGPRSLMDAEGPEVHAG